MSRLTVLFEVRRTRPGRLEPSSAPGVVIHAAPSTALLLRTGMIALALIRSTVFALRGALVLVSLFCAFMVVRTGDLGARLVWADRVGASNARGAPGGSFGAPSTRRGSSELFGGSSSSTEPPGGGSGGAGPSTRGE